jgi:uncharacterized protein (DUF362 family)
MDRQQRKEPDMKHSRTTRRGTTRRGFLIGGGLGVAAGGVAAWVGKDWYQRWAERHKRRDEVAELIKDVPYVRKQFTGKCVEVEKPAFALPGRYPGKVVEIHHAASVVRGEIQADAVRQMMERGLMELTGASSPVEGWGRFFEKGDRVGIKVNPVGRAAQSGENRKQDAAAAISNFAVIVAIVEGLKGIGLTHKDIVLFERYADEFRQVGYDTFLTRELPGVEWYAAAFRYAGGQTDLEGRDADERGRRPDPDPHVIGYDADHFRRFEFLAKEHNPNRAESYQSHVSKIVAGDLVNKIITIPVLKDHRSAGVTLALKNISHGMANNVARTHAGTAEGENRCGVFIPKIVALPVIRQKNVLHIMDGLIGCYEGGPGCWNMSWGTWEQKSLFFATDPVAMDHIGWDLLDAERAQRGWRPVAEMGLAGNNRSGSEQFHLRQPEHVTLGGFLELGIFEPQRIEYRRVELG